VFSLMLCKEDSVMCKKTRHTVIARVELAQ
jgi:hypothetical protein